jgi:hypothetical protein
MAAATATSAEMTLPGADFVNATCINNKGAIGGIYASGTNAYGFVYKGGKISTIDYANPNTPDTITNTFGAKTVVFVKIASTPTVTSINDRGDIVGYTTDSYKADDPGIHFLLGIEQSFWGTPLP